MDVYCTRPGCPRPVNVFADLDSSATLKTVQQKYCVTCGMPLILLGRYLTTKLLGRGGFGAAFLARDRYTPAMRQCVVKLFLPSGDLNPSQLQTAQSLFEREGAVLEELGNNHPQIPDLLAFFELDVPASSSGQPHKFFYLVQEFIDGKNLEEELGQTGTLSEAAVTEVLTSILPVLQYVHEHGSIHRDIKPSNIMRRRDGRLFLLDFGAVKQATSSAAVGGKASTGIYSMGFAPPEQMAGNTVYPATDLYALGVTCLMLLTGKDPSELYDSYNNSWNWRAYAQVSDRLEAILNRMLLPTPNQRFQSATEVLEALNRTPSPPPAPTPAPQPVQSAPTPQPTQSAPKPASSTALQQSQASAPASSPSPLPTKTASPPFSLMEWISAAAFTGFEGGLLAIALVSVLGTTLIAPGFWLLLVGGLILAQSRRWIERVDLLIVAAITLILMVALRPLRDLSILQALGHPIQGILTVAIATALLAILIALLFRLIYRLISGVIR